MISHKKTIISGVFILIMSLSFMAGCGEKHSQEISSSKTDDAGVISNTELESIANSGVVSLADDSPAGIWWIPKTQKNTLCEVLYWLQQAKPYEGEIPKDQSSGIFNANIEPSTLFITTSDKHMIAIKPAFYLTSNGRKSFISEVLQLSNNKQKSYIQSSQLFNWLKNDEWKTEFEMKQ